MSPGGEGATVTRRLWILIVLATIFGPGHHVDHVIRGNHVGWPLTAEVTPFTQSPGLYPLILLGVVLTRTRRVGPGYWTLLTTGGVLFAGLVHFGPFVVNHRRT